MNTRSLRHAPSHGDIRMSSPLRRPGKTPKAAAAMLMAAALLCSAGAAKAADTNGDEAIGRRAAELINTIRHKLDACGDEGMLSMSSARPVKTRAEIAARPLLHWNPVLAETARRHSMAMASEHFFDHVDPSGHTVGARARAAGYRYRVVGENLAAGHENIDEAVRGWLLSSGHCRNLIDSRFTEFGLARVSSPNPDDPYGTYWTLVLGLPQGGQVASR